MLKSVLGKKEKKESTQDQQSSSDHSINSQMKSEEELKEELFRKECRKGIDLLYGRLKLEGKYKNALSLKINRAKVYGDITNNASIATFKDVKIRVDLKSITNTIITSRYFTVYKFFQPGMTVSIDKIIDISNEEWKSIASYSFSIVDVKCK